MIMIIPLLSLINKKGEAHEKTTDQPNDDVASNSSIANRNG